MREIKFRGWNDKDKSMEMPYILGGEHCLGDYIEGMFFRNDVLMQYTGLKDKNGVEIYEGDIVQWNIFPEGGAERSKPYEVKFGYGTFYTDSTSPILGNIEPHRELEVIGNIHENPELLQ